MDSTNAGAAPEVVTLTGVDDETDIERMAGLSARFPVEWGILFAPHAQGSGRFPSLDFARAVVNYGSLRLAAHLCGGHARQVVENGSCHDLASLLGGNFDRVQINTAARDVHPQRIRRFTESLRVPGAILQARGEFPADTTVDWLFDRSGGRGSVPAFWPRARAGATCGYAGGLDADSIAVILPQIMQAAADARSYWIDMESGLRTPQDRFDLDRCELVLMQVYPER